MKKSLIIMSSLLITSMAAGIASANQYLPETNKIKSEVKTVLIRQGSTKNGPVYAAMDNNPAGYSQQVIGGRVIEGWIKDGVVYTAVDNKVVKTYQVNSKANPVSANKSNNNAESYAAGKQNTYDEFHADHKGMSWPSRSKK